jgi:hypothetical protein
MRLLLEALAGSGSMDAFWTGGFVEYVTGAVSQSFFPGQPVKADVGAAAVGQEFVFCVVRTISLSEAGQHVARVQADRVDGTAMAGYMDVPTERLCSMVGRMFDGVDGQRHNQQRAFLESFSERIGADPRGSRWQGEIAAAATAAARAAYSANDKKYRERLVRNGVLESMDDPAWPTPAYARSFQAYAGVGSCN